MNPTTKRLSWALAASLALNLFFAGFLTARALHEPSRGERRGPDALFLGPRGLLGPDAGDGARHVRQVMKRHGPGLREGRRELRQSRRAVREALAAEPFERAALERALSEMRARTNASQAALHAAMVDLAEQLPAQQRKKLGRRGRGGRHR